MSLSRVFSGHKLISFLPLLLVYIIVITIFAKPELAADEARYMYYAKNLSEGFYTDSEDPFLRNGPGYPLLITPFKMLGAHHLVYKLFNAVLMALAVLFFYKSVSDFLDAKKSLFLSYALGLYPPFLKWMAYIHSESLAVFLTCGALFFLIKTFQDIHKRKLHVAGSVLFIGFLILTKMIFAYVALALLMIYALIFLFKRRLKTKLVLGILLVSGFVSSPYLIYTNSITGKIFYWGNGGGEILYWRTTPFDGEHGDWISSDMIVGKVEHNFTDMNLLYQRHGDFIQRTQQYSHMRRDSLFKAKAVENIKKYPLKYVKNTGKSAFRLFFNFPKSYKELNMRVLFYAVPNAILLLFLFSALFRILKRQMSISFEIGFIALFAFTYLGGVILLNGIGRHLIPVVPMLFYLISSTFTAFGPFKQKA